MKLLTFAVDMLILEKCGKEIKEEQDHLLHIIKKYGLQINLDKIQGTLNCLQHLKFVV
jgi:hypothetical protein